MTARPTQQQQAALDSLTQLSQTYRKEKAELENVLRAELNERLSRRRIEIENEVHRIRKLKHADGAPTAKTLLSRAIWTSDPRTLNEILAQMPIEFDPFDNVPSYSIDWDNWTFTFNYYEFEGTRIEGPYVWNFNPGGIKGMNFSDPKIAAFIKTSNNHDYAWLNAFGDWNDEITEAVRENPKLIDSYKKFAAIE